MRPRAKDADDDGMVRDDYGGHPVFRVRHPHGAISDLIEEFKPDVAVASVGLIHPIVVVLLRERIPTAVYFRDLEFRD
jgi:hypothetical protein